MFAYVRMAALAYILLVFTGGYVTVSTLKGLWDQADRLQTLAAANTHAQDQYSRALGVYDGLEPSAGNIN
jgi:hypothetical protein